MYEKERHHATTLACGCYIGGENEPPVVHCPMHAAAERMAEFINYTLDSCNDGGFCGCDRCHTARRILRDVGR